MFHVRSAYRKKHPVVSVLIVTNYKKKIKSRRCRLDNLCSQESPLRRKRFGKPLHMCSFEIERGMHITLQRDFDIGMSQ